MPEQIESTAEKPKKNLKAAFYEYLTILLSLGIGFWAFGKNDISIVKTWFFIPLIPFCFCILYRITEIGNNLKAFGLTIAAIFAFLESIGINAFPAIAIFLFLALLLANYFSTEKTLSEVVKIFGGLAGGAFAQAKLTNYQTKKTTKSTKPTKTK
jgi:hypothetical protein